MNVYHAVYPSFPETTRIMVGEYDDLSLWRELLLAEITDQATIDMVVSPVGVSG